MSKFFDDLVVTEENGDIIIYITDVSRKFSMDFWCYSYLEPDSSGRILKFNSSTGCVSTIIENLCFPNGIEITDNNQSLLICELAKRRIIQYDLKEPNMGKISILIDNLPGEPENIRRTLNKIDETYWIGLALTRDYNDKLSFMDDYSTEPNLRKLILRLSYLLGNFFLKSKLFLMIFFLGMIMYNIGEFFNSSSLKMKGSMLKSGLMLILNDFMNNPGMAIEIDLQSNVLLSFQLKNDISVISEIEELSANEETRILLTTSSGGNLNRIVLK